MTIYLDVIWFLNLCIDYLLLKLTVIILKRQVKSWRLWLGTLLASSIVILLFTPLSIVFDHPIGKFLFSTLIILVVFGYHRFSTFLQNIFAFYFVAFGIGGGLFAAHYFFQSNSSYAGQNLFSTLSYGDPISWLFVVIGFPSLWLFSKKRFDQVVVRKWQHSTYAVIYISFLDKSISAKGIIDSGNKLYDPLTRVPVMFLNESVCKSFFPDSVIQEGVDLQNAIQNADLSDELRSRLTVIPYRTVSGKTQLITAFRPDEVILLHEGQRIKAPKVLVALTKQNLSGEGDFNSILHPDMLLHGKIIETAS
ncbi:sigma-E processing peptidase SpoIIGA [Terrilactibacillus sp. BCM23-1]|uniref:Sporulation sigma-E factor-processing peptidase n=1 Tax=Terrilactibacillus tamarindi TaxID=2599694 RepID=A0A6N8CPS7_9BACI|nr:sigma-E processing peptidase SpoIIGA [Terrilactibacillus tamarindi]